MGIEHGTSCVVGEISTNRLNGIDCRLNLFDIKINLIKLRWLSFGGSHQGTQLKSSGIDCSNEPKRMIFSKS